VKNATGILKTKRAVVTQFKILNSNFRYRHNSAPNLKLLAARLGTKGSASGNIAGVKRARAGG
jgi:hypothetical protein